MIRIVFAEDHQALIDGFAAYLEYSEEIKLIGTANDGEELVELVREKQPQVVITDIRMPKRDGIEATRLIKKEFPHIKIIALTMFDQKELVQKIIRAGANGYLLKNSGLKMLCEAVNQVMAGDNFYDPHLSQSFLKDFVESPALKRPKTLLSKRENDILYQIAQGKTSQEIAEKLFISKATIDTHRRNMVRKLKLSGSNALLQYAVETKFP
ncbi:MAG: response regulator transcription factor [Chlorobi bacterium]|nr:response regulator transcription factor [Chlorobiota bacterium]